MEVLSYTEANLALALQNEHTSVEQISNKNHFRYLIDYLAPDTGLGARCIVIEPEYINKDYLSDYSNYYSACFISYSKTCKRVHFFNNDFTADQIKTAIISGDGNAIWEAYLGFIVVKPIPVTVIGFTLFKTYPEGNRVFFGIRDYQIHFFGKEIKVKSLAFQEQDNVLSACATSAIWSMLQKAALDYHTTLKTPNEITRLAGLTGPDGSRLFPNKEGLSQIQMCEAIVASGLVTEIRQISGILDFDDMYLRELVSAYSAIGIPVILVISVLNTEDRRQKGDFSLHAVTVSGYNQNAFEPRPRQSEIHLECEAIDKLYVHDDQWGPFARMTLSPRKISGPWDLINGYTNVESVLIPLYPKIRIEYDDVKKVCVSMDKLLYCAYPQLSADFTWRIKLEFSEALKQNIRETDLPSELKFRVLSKSYPKYIWRATIVYSEVNIFDIVFDATDVSANMFAIELIVYEPRVKEYLNELFETGDEFRELFRNHKYFEFLRTQMLT